MHGSIVAALAPVILVLLVFEVWCLIDIVKRDVRYLPRWAWMAITLLSVPTGGIIYLLVGRGTPKSEGAA